MKMPKTGELYLATGVPECRSPDSVFSSWRNVQISHETFGFFTFRRVPDRGRTGTEDLANTSEHVLDSHGGHQRDRHVLARNSQVAFRDRDQPCMTLLAG